VAGFLYFVPDLVDLPDAAKLRALGLDYAFGRLPAARFITAAGPSGGPGLLLGEEGWADGTAIGYYPDRQTFRQNVETSKRPNVRTWVGLWTQRRPGPEDLLRRDALSGWPVRLGDGQEWLVPVARRFVEQFDELRYYNALPHSVDVDEAGRWTRRSMVGAYAGLWPIAERFWDWYIAHAPGGDAVGDTDAAAPSGSTWTDQEIYESAVTALAVNYHLGPAEVGLLGLLVDSRAGDILKALIDVPTLIEWSKKKALAAAAGT